MNIRFFFDKLRGVINPIGPSGLPEVSAEINQTTEPSPDVTLKKLLKETEANDQEAKRRLLAEVCAKIIIRLRDGYKTDTKIIDRIVRGLSDKELKAIFEALDRSNFTLIEGSPIWLKIDGEFDVQGETI